jgi:hypothetical protein
MRVTGERLFAEPEYFTVKGEAARSGAMQASVKDESAAVKI